MRLSFVSVLTALAVPFLASFAQAHEYRAGDIAVGHPYSFPTPGAAPSAIGYMTITNEGSEPDTLVAVEAPFEGVTLHRTEIGADGVARMLSEEGGVTVAPGETVTMEPGGGHVMFEGLGGDALEEGETIDAVLVFGKAGRLDVTFNVQARGEGASEADHSMHGMGGAAEGGAMGDGASEGGAMKDGEMDHSGHGMEASDGATQTHVNHSGAGRGAP